MLRPPLLAGGSPRPSVDGSRALVVQRNVPPNIEAQRPNPLGTAITSSEIDVLGHVRCVAVSPNQ